MDRELRCDEELKDDQRETFNALLAEPPFARARSEPRTETIGTSRRRRIVSKAKKTEMHAMKTEAAGNAERVRARAFLWAMQWFPVRHKKILSRSGLAGGA